MTHYLSYRNILCPAKVNLILRVGGPRSDGFHPIETLMAPLRWGDRVDVKIRSAQAFQISIDCPQLPNLPLEKNLLYKAAQIFHLKTGWNFEVHTRLRKNVPTGAGLGGGSGDAGVMLLILADAYKRLEVGPPISTEKLARMAARVGSDVAFFVYQSSAWCTGRGEICKPIFGMKNFPLVILLPKKVTVPTPWAYRTLDEFRKEVPPLSRRIPDWVYWPQDSYSVPELENDFEAPVFQNFKVMHEYKRALAEAGAIAAQMSGSGSALFGVFRSDSEARAAERLLNRRYSKKDFKAVATSTWTLMDKGEKAF